MVRVLCHVLNPMWTNQSSSISRRPLHDGAAAVFDVDDEITVGPVSCLVVGHVVDIMGSNGQTCSWSLQTEEVLVMIISDSMFYYQLKKLPLF